MRSLTEELPTQPSSGSGWVGPRPAADATKRALSARAAREKPARINAHELQNRSARAILDAAGLTPTNHLHIDIVSQRPLQPAELRTLRDVVQLAQVAQCGVVLNHETTKVPSHEICLLAATHGLTWVHRSHTSHFCATDMADTLTRFAKFDEHPDISAFHGNIARLVTKALVCNPSPYSDEEILCLLYTSPSPRD